MGDTMSDAVQSLHLDHVGILVRDMDAAIALLARMFGYRQATSPVVNTAHQVEVVFMEKDGSLPIKLFRPLDSSQPQAPRLHHLAFFTDRIDEAVSAMEGLGARVLSPPASAEAFDGHPIAFLFAGLGLNVELVSTRAWRSRLEAEPPRES